MKKIKNKIVTYMAIFMLVVGLGIAVPAANAANVLDNEGSGRDLGDLFILNELFAGGDSEGGGILNGSGNSSLGDLFVLDRLFGDSDGQGISSGSNSNLGDLFVLDKLFSDGGSGGGIFNGDSNNLGNLFILDRLFGENTDGVFGSGSTSSGNNDLGDLFILNKLFSDGGSGDGIFGGSGSSNLGNLFILDELFSDGGGVLNGDGDVSRIEVESGDTLSQIAADYLGDANCYTEIASLNNISNPNEIYPGEVFELPDSTVCN